METEVKSFEQVSATCDAAIGDCDIAITGLAVILNMNEHRIKVCVYETEKVDEFIKNKAKGTKVVGAHSLQEMVAQLKKPKRVMIQ